MDDGPGGEEDGIVWCCGVLKEFDSVLMSGDRMAGSGGWLLLLLLPEDPSVWCTPLRPRSRVCRKDGRLVGRTMSVDLLRGAPTGEWRDGNKEDGTCSEVGWSDGDPQARDGRRAIPRTGSPDPVDRPPLSLLRRSESFELAVSECHNVCCGI